MSDQTILGGEASKTVMAPKGLALVWYRLKKSLVTPAPYMMLFGIVLWLGTYYLLTEGWKVPRFEKIPGPVEVITEFFSYDPIWARRCSPKIFTKTFT